jgi:hypothetical protein
VEVDDECVVGVERHDRHFLRRAGGQERGMIGNGIVVTTTGDVTS